TIGRNRALGLPVLLVEHIAQHGRRKLGAFFMLRRPRKRLRVLPQLLDKTHNAVDLAPDPVEGRYRLLALTQSLDLRGRPLHSMPVAASFLLLLDLLPLRREIIEILPLQAGEREILVAPLALDSRGRTPRRTPR